MDTIFKAMNDPTRREILRILRKKDLTAGQIAEKFDMTAPSISHHLDKLKRADLVTTIKQGQYIFYSINTTIIDDLLQYLLTFKNKIPCDYLSKKHCFYCSHVYPIFTCILYGRSYRYKCPHILISMVLQMIGRVNIFYCFCHVVWVLYSILFLRPCLI